MKITKRGFEIPDHLDRDRTSIQKDLTDGQWVIMAMESEIRDIKTLRIYLRNRGASNKTVKKINSYLIRICSTNSKR